MKDLIRKMLRENIEEIKVELKSKSDKGNRYFEMLKTAKFQHYDMPKGDLATFTHGEEDRKRLVTHLSKEDKKTYRAWLKTPEGQDSIERFEKYCTVWCRKDTVNENTRIDKYGDELKTDKNWTGFNFTIPEFKTKVKDSLVGIIVDEQRISEKAFEAYDNVISKVKHFFIDNDDTNVFISKYENKNVRPQLVAEIIYNKYKKLFD